MSRAITVRVTERTFEELQAIADERSKPFDKWSVARVVREILHQHLGVTDESDEDDEDEDRAHEQA